jgi:hypothetical protein
MRHFLSLLGLKSTYIGNTLLYTQGANDAVGKDGVLAGGCAKIAEASSACFQ